MPIDLKSVKRSTLKLTRYDIRIESRPGLTIEGVVDTACARQAYRMGFSDGEFPLAEVHWIDTQGFGRPIISRAWFVLSDGPLPNHPELAVGLLDNGDIVSEEPGDLRSTFVLKMRSLGLLDNRSSFVERLLSDPRNRRETAFRRRFTEEIERISLHVEVRVEGRSGPISGYTVRTLNGSIETTMSVDFTATTDPVPDPPDDMRIVRGRKIPSPMLCFRMKKIAGWSPLQTHAVLAERAIGVIRDHDSQRDAHLRLYSELYDWKITPGKRYTKWLESDAKVPKAALDFNKHHPVVLGSHYEDNEKSLPYHDWFLTDKNYKKNSYHYWSQDDYFRDYHHFGGQGTGLEHQWYFAFRGEEPTTAPGDRYYSARDWGYGAGRIDENLNRLTFTQAIGQYSRCNAEGRRNAYLMLGHVVHLLQDVGQPDHARLVSHAGSGMTMETAYSTYQYCTLMASWASINACAACAIFCPICAAVAFSAAGAACALSIDEAIVGYERLIADRWNISQAEALIKTAGITRCPGYDDYFLKMAGVSIAAADSRGLASPLGCEDLLFFIPNIPPPIPVPGTGPAIDSESDAACEPYFNLTTELVPSITSLTAGLICHFFDIVNPPPMLERLRIVQWEPNAKPIAFGILSNQKALHCVRYDAEWELKKGDPAPGGPRQRDLKFRAPTQMLTTDRPAYIFVVIGPTDPPARSRAMTEIELRLTGTYPGTGRMIDEPVKLELEQDADLGSYYWGCFWPRNCSRDPYLLSIAVTGRDCAAHLKNRSPVGDEVDGDPSTVAEVALTVDGTGYPWVHYHPGADRTHKIQVAAFQNWRLKIQPVGGHVVLGNDISHEETVSFKLEQSTWDCGWEPVWGPLQCLGRWALLPDVLSTRTGNRSIAADVGFEAALAIGRQAGVASLVLRLLGPDYVPGTYEVGLEYNIGEANASTTYATQAYVELR
jgi:hypothetical protein